MKQWLLYPGIASTATLILHFAVGLDWGLSSFAAFLGWPLIGTLITADDDLPGGWSNPDGTVKPPWRTSAFWGKLAAGFGVAAFVAAFDFGILTNGGVGFVCLGFMAATVSFGLFRRHFRSPDAE
jgi:hypothetical protein